MAHLRNCTLCGTTYDYCPRCDETKPTFYLKYCSDNCKNISVIINKFGFKHLTKDEAAKELAALDLSKLEQFRDRVKETIKDIMKPIEKVSVTVDIADLPTMSEPTDTIDPYESIPVKPEIEEEAKEPEVKEEQPVEPEEVNVEKSAPKYNRRSYRKTK